MYFDFLLTSQIKTSSAFKIKNCHSAEFYKTFCRFSVWLELCSDMIKTVCWLCSQVSGVDYLMEGGRSEMFGVPGCRVYGRGRDWLAWVMWSVCFGCGKITGWQQTDRLESSLILSGHRNNPTPSGSEFTIYIINSSLS